MSIHATLEGPDIVALASALQEQWSADERGDVLGTVSVRCRGLPKLPDDWRTLWDGRSAITLVWRGSDEWSTRLIAAEPDIVTINDDEAADDPDVILELLAPLPFESATVAPEYGVDDLPQPPSLAEYHEGIGHAVLLKGPGHDRLVSRRLLERGPWRRLRNETHDVTLLQLHELGVDRETAWRQAAPGYAALADDRDGGFVPTLCRITNELSLFYHADAREMRIVWPEAVELPRSAMRDACTLRYHHKIPPERYAATRARHAHVAKMFGPQNEHVVAPPPATEPFDHVGFVFVTDAEAQLYLHDLWLRDLRCWSMEGGGLRRLDEAYDPPPPTRPEWIDRA